MTVVHIITSLEQGGAEAVLYRLIAASQGTTHVVVSLKGAAYYGDRIASLGTRVLTLDLDRLPPLKWLARLIELRRTIRDIKPDVVQTWMHHADLIGGVVARLAETPTVWGVRNSTPPRQDWIRRLIVQLCALLSPVVPSRIVTCSNRAVVSHAAVGYARDRFVVIPNGYDLTAFSPDLRSGQRLRAQFGIPSSMPLCVTVARWDSQKDHRTLLRAIALLSSSGQRFQHLLVGRGLDSKNVGLCDLISRMRLSGAVLLAGPRDDIPSVMNAADLHVLSSRTEAFPNVVAEAMACGTPCVVTDVGDAAFIIGDSGWVVPPGDPERLAEAMGNALSTLENSSRRDQLGRRCRQRVVENFGLERMVASYQNIWRIAAEGSIKVARRHPR